MSARIRNPFTPSFGQIPLYMAGRDLVIDEIMRAFENGVGDPNLSTILIGARGSGKTALMSLLAHEAQGFGWLSVNVSALPGMLEDIAQQAKAVASSIVSVSSHAKIKALGSPNSRYRMGKGCGRAAELAHAHERDSRRAERFRCRSSYHGRRSASRS